MDKTLNAWHDLYECAVVSDENDFTLNLVANLEVLVEALPRVSAKLLETEGDPLLLLVEVENDNFDLLVELDDLLRVVDTAP